MTRLHVLLAFSLLVPMHTGCASGPPYGQYVESAASPAPGRGRVYIYRPSAMPLLGPAISVHVNDVLVKPWLSQRRFLVIDQPEGEVRVRIYSGEQVFSLESGETRYVRIAVSLGPFDSGRLYLELAEADVARSELEGLRLAGEVTGQADPFR